MSTVPPRRPRGASPALNRFSDTQVMVAASVVQWLVQTLVHRLLAEDASKCSMKRKKGICGGGRADRARGLTRGVVLGVSRDQRGGLSSFSGALELTRGPGETGDSCLGLSGVTEYSADLERRV